MTPQQMIQVSEWMLGVVVFIGIVFGLMAFIYDVRAVVFRRRLREEFKEHRPDQSLHITILVYARNNETTIDACLAGIAGSRYRQYDVVIINDRSTDRTGRIVKRYQRNYPSKQLYLYENHTAINRHRLLKKGYTKSQKGEVVLVLDATSLVSSTLLGESVLIFNDNQNLKALHLNEASYGISGILQLHACFVRLSHNVVMKSFSIVSVGRVVTIRSNALYAKDIFEAGNSRKKVPYEYNGSLCVTNAPFRTAQVPAVLSIVVVFFMTFFIYAAVSLQTNMLLLFSWLALLSWLILVVWSDEVSTLRQKAILTFCIPAYYFLLYVYLALQGMYRGTKYVVRTTSPYVVTRQPPITATEHKL